jgi:hypothetical protein
MQIELAREDAVVLYDTLRHRMVELDQEISRTESLAFKRELRDLDRTLERVIAALSTALTAEAPQPRT